MATDTQIEPVQVSPFAALLKNAAARQFVAMVAIAASVALGISLVLWTRAPSMGPLYADLTEAQVAEVVQALETAGIKYQIGDASGQVLVDKSQRPKTRMLLAEQGLPSTTASGLEILTEEPKFGTSMFREFAQYQRAREVELERSIATLDWVQSARVHIASPTESVFVRERKPASATVKLNVIGTQALPREKARAIVYMVASAIPNLSANAVTVVDQHSNLHRLPNEDDESELPAKQFKYKQREEAAYVQKIENLLTKQVGHGNYTAQVSAVFDFTERRETAELFDPASSAVRGERETTSERRGPAPEGGVPGALNNQPPVTGQDPAPADGGAQISASTDTTRNFDTGRRVQSVKAPVGTLGRLSIAVVVDNVRTVDAEGNVTSRPRTPEEMAAIESTVRGGVGFDAARGDTLEVINSEFPNADVFTEQPAPEFWQTAWFLEAVRQGIGLLLALVVFFKIVRPLARSVIEASTAALPPPAEALALPDGGALAIEDQSEDGAKDASAKAANEDDENTQNAEDAEEEEQPPTLEERMDAARQMIDEDPERVASIVKEWVTPDDE